MTFEAFILNNFELQVPPTVDFKSFFFFFLNIHFINSQNTTHSERLHLDTNVLPTINRLYNYNPALMFSIYYMRTFIPTYIYTYT